MEERREEVSPDRRMWRIYSVVIVVAFGVLIATGTTMSSLGIQELRVDRKHDYPGMIGMPRSIRSDEFLRTSMWRIGALVDRDTSFATPLAADGELLTAMVSSGIVSRLVLAESFLADLGRVVPDEVVYALLWWAPSLLFWLFGPRLFAWFGMTFPIALFVTALTYLAPSVAWWSIGTINSGFATSIAASLLLLHAARLVAGEHERRLVFSVVACAGAALLIARIPFAYAPWAIPTSAGVLVPTGFVAVRRFGWRPSLYVFAVVGITAVAAVAATILEHRVAFEALRGSVYPGARRSTARALDIGFLFGAPHLAVLKSSNNVLSTNASEISSAPTILAVPCVLFAFATVGDWKRRLSPAWWGVAVVFVGIFGWITIDIPLSVGQQLPGISLTPPARAAQVIGFLATIWFGITLAHLRCSATAIRSKIGVGSAVVVGFILALSGSSLRVRYLPDLTEPDVLRNSILAAGGIGVAVALPNRRWALVPLVAFAAAVAVGANPIIAGLGDLRESSTAQEIRRLDHQVDGFWLTNSIYLDALLMANAIPSISGQQWTGPDKSTWRKLDPDGGAEEQWNRGSAFVAFAFDPIAPRPRIISPAPDFIRVVVDPCDRRLTALQVRVVASTIPLDRPCLTNVGTVRWGGAPTFLYRRDSDPR